MNRQQLKYLFNKYLKRNYSDHEWMLHGHKVYSLFEKELLACEEYRNLNNKFKPNIAILITGHVRKNSLLNGINQFCSQSNCHIFIHTWDNIGIKGNETSSSDPIVKDNVLNEINKYINLKSYEIENNAIWVEKNKEEKTHFNLSSPEVFIKSQLYSINRSYNLMEEYSIKNEIEYDVVFKFRFDCAIHKFQLSDLTINNIKNNNIIFTPNLDCMHHHIDYGTSCWACDNMYYKHNLTDVHYFEHTNIICDLFAYGNKNSMKKYCDLYNNYDNLNDSFFDDNMKQYKKYNKNIKYENGNYVFKGLNGHIDSLYYYNCSYPERLLQKYLKEYMLVESKDVKLKLVR